MPILNRNKFAYKLKGATDGDIEFLFANEKLLDKQERVKLAAELADRKRNVVERIKLNKSNKRKLENNLNGIPTFDRKRVADYKDAILKDKIALKRIGEEATIDDIISPFSANGVEDNKKLFSEDEISKFNEVKPDKFKAYENLTKTTYSCYKYFGKQGIDRDKIKDEFEEEPKNLEQIYEEIYAYKAEKKFGKGGQIEGFESLMDHHEVLDSIQNDKAELCQRIGIKDAQFNSIITKIKRLKAYEDEFDRTIEQIKDPKHIKELEDKLNYALDVKGRTSEYRQAKNISAEQAKALENDEKELKEIENQQRHLKEYENLINKLDKKEKESGKEILNDNVIEYQRDLRRYSKMSNSEKAKNEELAQNLDVKKRYFDEYSIDTKTYRFTKAEKELAEKNKDGLENLRNSKKAYEKENIVGRFFSHFVPRSWTRLGKMRDKIDNDKKALEEKGFTTEHLNEYMSMRDREEAEKINDNISNQAVENQPIKKEANNDEVKMVENHKKQLFIQNIDPINNVKLNEEQRADLQKSDLINDNTKNI